MNYVPDKCTVTLVTEAFVDFFKWLNDENRDQRQQRIDALLDQYLPLKKEHRIDLLVRAPRHLDVEKASRAAH